MLKGVKLLLRNADIFRNTKRVLGSVKHLGYLNERLPLVANSYVNKIAIIDAQEKYSYKDLLQLSYGLKGNRFSTLRSEFFSVINLYSIRTVLKFWQCSL